MFRIVKYFAASDDATQTSIFNSGSISTSSLQNNGGPTETYALLAGSAGIDSAYNFNSVSDDQRGSPRPAGSGYDVGAFETQDSIVVVNNPQANDDTASTDPITSTNINVFSNDDGGTYGIDTNSINITNQRQLN